MVPTTLFCDNKTAITLFKDATAHACIKHFDIKYHFIQECMQMREIIVKYINIRDNVTNIFMKAISKLLFICLCHMLGMS